MLRSPIEYWETEAAEAEIRSGMVFLTYRSGEASRRRVATIAGIRAEHRLLGALLDRHDAIQRNVVAEIRAVAAARQRPKQPPKKR